MIFNENKETMEKEKLLRLQSKTLKKLLRRVNENVSFYREKFKEAGVDPSSIESIEEISRLPFTTKDDMRDIYPLGLLAVPKEEIVEVHTSSGTTGKPVVNAYTAADIELWSEVMARALSMAGARRSDTIQNAYGYGLFTGGLGVHYGARKLGANIIPISGGNTKRQLQMLQDFESDILTCTPSYSLYLAEEGRAAGIDFKELPLRVIIPGAEPWSENMRKEIESNLSVTALDIYGLTEIIGPGVAQECEEKNGLHIFEDHFYPEIIDPETGEPLPDGEKGELVITTLTKEGAPIIRYRTRDITYLMREKCPCGRTHVRMHRIMGRTDDMLIIRGVNVFPSQIEEVLLQMEGVQPHYQLVVSRKGRLDALEVRVEIVEKFFSDEIKIIEQTEQKIASELHSALGINVRVKLVEPKSIPRSEGKAKRIIDMREQ